MYKKLRKQEKGFTIIEVLIVLAIAGVIMLVVFLAVPSLQRNSRNTQRRSDASHLAGLISEWQTNHGGTPLSKFDGTGGPDLTNEHFQIMTSPAGGDINAYAAPGSPVVDTFYVFKNATCNGSAGVNGGGGSRSFVVLFYVEPGTTLQCVD